MATQDVEIVVFDWDIFALWKMMIKAHLMSLGVDGHATTVSWYTILDTILINHNGKRFYQNNVKEKNDSLAGLSDNELIKVMRYKSTKNVWEKL